MFFVSRLGRFFKRFCCPLLRVFELLWHHGGLFYLLRRPPPLPLSKPIDTWSCCNGMRGFRDCVLVYFFKEEKKNLNFFKCFKSLKTFNFFSSKNKIERERDATLSGTTVRPCLLFFPAWGFTCVLRPKRFRNCLLNSILISWIILPVWTLALWDCLAIRVEITPSG